MKNYNKNKIKNQQMIKIRNLKIIKKYQIKLFRFNNKSTTIHKNKNKLN